MVRERRVHGTVERQFALKAGSNYYTDQQKKELTPADVAQVAGVLTSLVSQEFGRYAQTAVTPFKDGEFSMVATSVYLSDEEIQELRQIIRSYVAKEGRQPEPGLERRLVAFFSVPQKDE